MSQSGFGFPGLMWRWPRDLGERRRPQDGRIKTRSPGGREVEMRVSTMPTAFGEKCVLRIFDPDVAFRSIEQLGLRLKVLNMAAVPLLVAAFGIGFGWRRRKRSAA